MDDECPFELHSGIVEEEEDIEDDDFLESFSPKAKLQLHAESEMTEPYEAEENDTEEMKEKLAIEVRKSRVHKNYFSVTKLAEESPESQKLFESP